jgi:hypothetical protein
VARAIVVTTVVGVLVVLVVAGTDVEVDVDVVVEVVLVGVVVGTCASAGLASAIPNPPATSNAAELRRIQPMGGLLPAL